MEGFIFLSCKRVAPVNEYLFNFPYRDYFTQNNIINLLSQQF